MWCALNAAKAGYRVGVCSREMTASQYGTRIFQSGTDISSYKLRTGDLSLEDWAQLAQTMGYYQGYNVSFLFNTKDVEDLRAAVQQRVDGDGLDMLVVDYTQLMRTKQKFDADYQRIGYVTKTLKDMTTDFNISVLALAQVGRGSAGDMPSLEELRGSGDMEQDADNVLFLHRPEKSTDAWIAPGDINLFNVLQRDGRQYIAVRVAKQRQGQIGSLAMVFNPDKMTYIGVDNTYA
jgi:replicative DNA helicase